MDALDYADVQKRAKGRLVVIGWEIDRVMGIFSTVEKAMKALDKAPERSEHNWWMEFRKLDRWERPCVFERILLKTRAVSSVEAR